MEEQSAVLRAARAALFTVDAEAAVSAAAAVASAVASVSVRGEGLRGGLLDAAAAAGAVPVDVGMLPKGLGGRLPGTRILLLQWL